MMPKYHQRYGFNLPSDIDAVSDVHNMIINPADLEKLGHFLNIRNNNNESNDDDIYVDVDEDNDIETNPDDVFTVEGSRTKTSSEIFGQRPSRQLGQHQPQVPSDFNLGRSGSVSMPLSRNQYQLDLPFSSPSNKKNNDDDNYSDDSVDIETNPDDVFTVEGSRTKTSSEVFGQHPCPQLGQHQQQIPDYSMRRSETVSMPLSRNQHQLQLPFSSLSTKKNNDKNNKLDSPQRSVGNYWYSLRKSNPGYSSSSPPSKAIAIPMSPTTLTQVEEAPPTFRLPEENGNKKHQATDEYPSFIMIDGKLRRQQEQQQQQKEHDKPRKTRTSTGGSGSNSKTSVWKKDICGIRADQFILFWILILLISVVVIVVAMVLSLIKSSSSSSTLTASSTDNSTTPTENQDIITYTIIPTMAPTTNQLVNQPASCKTDVVVDDDEIEFPDGNGSFADCLWLSNHPEAHELLCIPDRAAYEFCPLTCQNCNATGRNWPTKECGEDDHRFEFVTEEGQTRNCDWLANSKPDEIESFCQDFDIFMFCRETCRNCGPVIPTSQPNTKPMKPSAP